MKELVLFLCSALVSSQTAAIPYPLPQQPAIQNGDDFSIQVDGPGIFNLWDDARGELVTSGSYQRREGAIAEAIINIYNSSSGKKRSLNLLEEFPNARFVSVNGLAMGASGSVLVACELGIVGGGRTYGLDRILVYDNHSALIRNFSAVPDAVGGVAMDGRGNIYVVGMHDEENSSEESYPLIVKYDEYGHTTQEMLPRSLFADVDDPVDNINGSSHGGSTRLTASDKSVEVYLAPVTELITLSQAGEIQTRVNVSSRLTEFAETKGYKNFDIDGDLFSPSGDLWLIGHLKERSDNSLDPLTVRRNFVVRLTPEGQLEVPSGRASDEPPGHYLPQLVGFTQLGEPIGYIPTSSPHTVVLRRNPY